MFWVVCTGSRQWKDREMVRIRLAELQKQHGRALQVVHGASRGGGADSFVHEACEDFKIDVHPTPVRPDLDGRHRGAPLNRNKRMVLTYMPDLVLAFRSDGKSNGTDQTVDFAQGLGYAVDMNHEDDK